MRRSCVLIGLALAACNDATEPAQPLPTYSVVPQSQWSGGRIFIRSSSFMGQATLPTIVSPPAETIAVARVDDSTLSATVPLGPSGSLTLYALRGKDTLQVGGVRRYGLHEVRTLPQPLFGELTVQTVAGDPVVFGAVLPNQFLAFVDLATDQGTVVDSLTSPGLANYGMSPTEVPGVFIVANPRHANQVERWQLLPTVQPLDTAPYQQGVNRHLARLAPHVWLQTGHHDTFSLLDTIPGGISSAAFDAQLESVWDVYLSPRGDRSTVSVNDVLPQYPGRLPGVPVYRTASGDTAFTIPLSRLDAAAFSATGDRIFAAGFNLDRPFKVVAVDATSGTLLAEATLPDSLAGYALVHDPVRDQVLVTVASDSAMAVYVYDASTLALAGMLPAPDPCPSPVLGNCIEGVMAVDATRRQVLYVASTGIAKSYVYDLLP
jgi:hypothetical protein